jgi:hypothetical protein
MPRKRFGERDPKRVKIGKETIEKMKGMEMEEEFKVQARVGLISMANLAKELNRRGEITSIKSITKLTQAAFEIAVIHLNGGENIIEDTDEAIDFLEEIGLIDARSSSISAGAIRRNNRRLSMGDYGSRNERARKKLLTQEEVDREVLRSPAVQAFLREKREREMLEQARTLESPIVAEQQEEQKAKPITSIRKYTKEEIEYMNERGNRMDLPGLMPDPTRKEPDFVLGETQEEKMERFKKANEMKLDEQYPQEQ